jgi:hypothetical protein
MPFIARCTFCNRRSQAPDRALGASGRCPKCSSFFTLVPDDGGALSAPCTEKAAEVPPPPALPRPAPPHQRVAAGGNSEERSFGENVPSPAVPPRRIRDGIPQPPPGLDGFGLIAFLMATAGLMLILLEGGLGFAAVASFLGFITGVAGVARSRLVGWGVPRSAALAGILGAGVFFCAAVLAANSAPAPRPAANTPAAPSAAGKAPAPLVPSAQANRVESQ